MKPAWVSWEIMTRPKYMGGLGFLNLEMFNIDLLARRAWRVLNNPNSLSSLILKATYFPETGILEAELGAHPSQIWRAIIDGRDIMKQGIIRRIWTGEDTMIWEHNWIPRDAIPRPIVSLVHDPPTRVHELIEQTTATWKEELVRSVFIPTSHQHVHLHGLAIIGIRNY